MWKNVGKVWDICGILWDIRLHPFVFLLYCIVDLNGEKLDNFRLNSHQTANLRYNGDLEIRYIL